MGEAGEEKGPFARNSLVYPPRSSIAALLIIQKGIVKHSKYSREFLTVYFKWLKGHTRESGISDSSESPCVRVLLHFYVTMGVAFVSHHNSVHVPINSVRRVYEEDNERNFR